VGPVYFATLETTEERLTYISTFKKNIDKVNKRRKIDKVKAIVEKHDVFLLPRKRTELERLSPSDILHEGQEILGKQLVLLRISEYATRRGIVPMVHKKGQNTLLHIGVYGLSMSGGNVKLQIIIWTLTGSGSGR